jgi:hypothetical protein
MQVSLNAGVTYSNTTSDPNAGGQRDVRIGSLDQNNGNGFRSFLGASFNFLLGEPATGNTLSALYGLVYRYPSAERSGSTENGRERPLDQQLSVAGQLELGRATYRLGISFADLAGPDRDSGGYAERQLFTVTPSVSYPLTPKTTFSSSLSLPYREVTGGASVSGLTNTNFLDYSFDAKLQIGLGLTIGSEKAGGAENEPFQRLLARFGFPVTPRVAISGTCGVEWREDGEQEQTEPVFDLHASWSPRLGTSFTLSCGRETQSSTSLSGAGYVSTTFNLSAVQRLGGRMTLQLSVGYEQADYRPSPQDNFAQRQDQLFTGQASLQFDLGRRWSASLAYDYEDNRSTTNSYTASQAQFQLSLLF